jgi:HPt (histidine-containing phosphotransfer) domain-containing protein
MLRARQTGETTAKINPAALTGNRCNLKFTRWTQTRPTGAPGIDMDRYEEESVQSAIDLEALKVRCLGNLALVERVLCKFTGQLDADLDALEQAIVSNNAEQAAQLAHRIKGTAGSVSAKPLYEHASRAEQRALEAELDGLPNDLEQMRNDRERLVQTIESVST